MSRAVCGVSGALHRSLTEVTGMPAKSALGNLAILGPIKRQAEVLQLKHRFHSLLAHDLGYVLVAQVVRTLYCIEKVPLRAVGFFITQGRTDPTLGRAGVAPYRIEFGEYRHIVILLAQFKGATQPRAPCTDNNRVKFVDHPRPLNQLGQAVPWP